MDIAVAFLIFCGLAGFGLAMYFKRPLAWLVSAVPWIVLAIVGYTGYTTAWDALYLVWWIGMAMMVVSVLMALQTRSLDAEESEVEPEPGDAVKYTTESEEYGEKQRQINKATARRSSGRKRR